MPVYQDKQTKRWKYRTYAEDIYGIRKQYQKGGFETKREALHAERMFLLNQGEKIYDITFNELWENYDTYIKLKLKYNSYRSVKNRIVNHILPYFGNYRLSKITPQLYVRWQTYIENQDYTHKYKTSLHGAIRTILNFAMKFYGLKTNVATLVGNFRRKYEQPKMVDFWTYEEFQQFINVIEDDMYKLFFEILYLTGIRQGECLGLTWNDFNGNSIMINKTLTREIQNGKKVSNSPKTLKSNRTIRLDSKLTESLKNYKKECEKYIDFDGSWYIFGGLTPLSTTTVTRKKDYYCNLAGVKKIRIHDFRHSHASLLLSMGVPITEISERLGHSNIEMTLNTYSHMLPSDEEKALAVLNQLRNT